MSIETDLRERLQGIAKEKGMHPFDHGRACVKQLRAELVKELEASWGEAPARTMSVTEALVRLAIFESMVK